MVELKVIAIENLPTHDSFDADDRTGNIVPKIEDNYDYRLLPANFLRKDDKPITYNYPEGPSYTVKGNEIKWQKFKMRIG